MYLYKRIFYIKEYICIYNWATKMTINNIFFVCKILNTITIIINIKIVKNGVSNHNYFMQLKSQVPNTFLSVYIILYKSSPDYKKSGTKISIVSSR